MNKKKILGIIIIFSTLAFVGGFLLGLIFSEMMHDLASYIMKDL